VPLVAGDRGFDTDLDLRQPALAPVGMTREGVRAAVAAERQALLACHASVQRDDPGLPPWASADLHIGPAGVRANLTATQPDLAACLGEVLAELPLRSDGPVQVALPLRFADSTGGNRLREFDFEGDVIEATVDPRDAVVLAPAAAAAPPRALWRPDPLIGDPWIDLEDCARSDGVAMVVVGAEGGVTSVHAPADAEGCIRRSAAAWRYAPRDPGRTILVDALAAPPPPEPEYDPRTDGPPVVRIGQAHVVGALGAGTLRRYIRLRSPAFRACYERALLREGRLSGRIGLELVLDEGYGRLVTARASTDSTGSTLLAPCLTEAAQRIHVPRVEGGGRTHVRYPLWFSPRPLPPSLFVLRNGVDVEVTLPDVFAALTVGDEPAEVAAAARADDALIVLSTSRLPSLAGVASRRQVLAIEGAGSKSAARALDTADAELAGVSTLVLALDRPGLGALVAEALAAAEDLDTDGVIEASEVAAWVSAEAPRRGLGLPSADLIGDDFTLARAAHALPVLGVELVHPSATRGVAVVGPDTGDVVVRVDGDVDEVTVNGVLATPLPKGLWKAAVPRGADKLVVQATDTRGSVALVTAAIETARSGRAGRTGRDVALLIATDTYAEWTDLANPIFDARSLRDVLTTRYGFEVELLENPSKADILETLRGYIGREWSPDDQLLVFVAGHGLHDEVEDLGFIVPTDALRDDPGFGSYLGHVRFVNAVDRIGAEHVLVVLDVCFGGTFFGARGTRGGGVYADLDLDQLITRTMAHRTRKWITSGGKEYVFDGEAGSHSPFAHRLLQALEEDRSYLGFDGLMERLKLAQPGPQRGSFGQDEPASDFLFLPK
jgi:hypothetical protein